MEGQTLTDVSMKKSAPADVVVVAAGWSRPGVSPNLDPDHQNHPQPRGRPATPAQPGTIEGEAHRAGEDGQQPDLTPPATRAATRGPSPPEIRRPPDQIAGTTPTPLLTAGDKGPRRGPPPRSKTLRCEPEQRMPRRRSPWLRHGPCPAAASCGGEGKRGGRGATPARGELPPRRPLGAARGRGERRI